MLAAAPPDEFADELGARGVSPLSRGHVIVATWEPHDATVQQVIRELNLELQIIFNKGAVMVLPSGVNKATGLARALQSLGLSRHNTVGIGDAENDLAFLVACELSAAVANALDSVKARVDLITTADHGAGVVELTERIVATDDGREVRFAARAGGVRSSASAGFTDAWCPPSGGPRESG